MHRSRLLALSLLVITSTATSMGSAQTRGRRKTTAARPSSGAFSNDRLARIDRFLQQYIDSGRIGGAVALVLRDGNVAYQHAAGWSDVESHRPVTVNSLFRIASQTKALTTVAILSLVERREIGFRRPRDPHNPEFAHTNGASPSDTRRSTEPA